MKNQFMKRQWLIAILALVLVLDYKNYADQGFASPAVRSTSSSSISALHNLLPREQMMSLQLAPANFATTSMNQLVTILTQNTSVKSVAYSHYNDVSRGVGGERSQAPLQIVETKDAGHRYLGVFHSQDTKYKNLFSSWLSYSNDLTTWTTLGEIHHASSMPTLRILSDDSVLLAEERNTSGQRPYIQLTYYKNMPGQTGAQGLIANPANNNAITIAPIQTQGSLTDGTPEISAIVYHGDIRQSRIVLSRHYEMPNGGMDTEGLGILTNFSTYQDLGNDVLANQALVKAGAIAQHGGRTFFYVGPQLYELAEGNTQDQNFGTWSLFLLKRDQDLNVQAVVKLPMNLPGGATSIGNPHLSFLKLPNGHNALVSTMFVFSENVHETPAGGHTFIYDIGL